MALILNQWRGENNRLCLKNCAHRLYEESRGLHKIRACSQESMTRNKGVRILISSSRIVSKTVIGWRR